nr:reverse transcriptase domain-containing protein [Tanacetum cinerariifolium]
MLLVTQIDTFDNGLTLSHRDTINTAVGGTFMQNTPEECYELIENMTTHHNHWDTSAIRDETSRNISSTSTTESPEVVRQLEMMNKNFSKIMRQFQTVKAIDTKCSLPSNTVANHRADIKAITTRSGATLAGPSISPPPSKAVDRELETITDQPKLAIPYPSRANKQKHREKDDILALKFLEIFRNLHFKLSFADTLLHMPKFALRPFLRTGRALIDDYGEELTLRVDDEARNFKVGQTSKYSYNDAESINRIDVIDEGCEEYVQEVFGFSNKSSNSTPISDPIIALSSLSPTPFEGGKFILEEIEACLTSKSIPPGINDTDLDLEGDVRLLEELLNNNPSLSSFLPKELNVEEIKTVKSSIDEPPELKLKELPSHLEYAFLEGIDKLPVIISKELKDEEKSILLKVLSYTNGLSRTFQRRLMATFHNMIEKTMDVIMDDFLVFGDSFSSCLSHLDKIIQRCEQDYDGSSSTLHYYEKELLAVVYAFKKFRPYLVLSKTIVYTDHSALKYLLAKQDVKPRLLRISADLEDSRARDFFHRPLELQFSHMGI